MAQELNIASSQRRIPPSIPLSENDCHDLEALLNEMLTEVATGLIVQVTKTPYASGTHNVISLRQREDGLIS